MKVEFMICTAAAIAALSVVSCTKDLQENAPVSGNESGKVTLLIPADEVTKTTFGDKYEVKWEDNSDKIGVFISSSSASSSTNVSASLKRGEDGKAYFEARVSEYSADDKLYAYYPYAENAGKDASKVTLKIPYIQTQTAPDKFNGSNNPMVAVPIELPAPGSPADGTVIIPEQLKFRHIGAVLEFDITGVPSDETLKSVQFVSGDGYPATDNSAYDLTSVTKDGEMTTKAGTYYKSVTVSLEGDGFTPGQSSKVYMTLVHGKYTGNIYISTDKNLYRYTGKTIEADRATVKTITADLSSSRADKSKEIKSALDYEVFAMAANAGDYSAWVDTESDEVKLGSDISTPTYFTRIQKDWTGKFNGQGHKITQNASVVPLFTVIREGASVSNLVLEGSKKSMADAGTWGSAAVAQVNYGTIENVKNNISIDFDNLDSGSAIAGIVKCNAGLLKDCEQNGNITINCGISNHRVLYVGGIAGFASDTDWASSSEKSGNFENCTNNGKITVTKSATGAFTLQKYAVGGICAIVHRGDGSSYSTFSNCQNNGQISCVDLDATSTPVDNGAGMVLGGIIGRISDTFTEKNLVAFNVTSGYYAKITDCHNNEAILEQGSYSNAADISSNSGARTGCVGGIVGYANGLKDNPVDILDCSNSGTIKGGYVKNCVMGGICGQTNYVNIRNAEVTATFSDSDTQAHAVSTVGGFVGMSLNTLRVSGSKVDISGTLTPTPVGIGVLQGYVRSGTAEYTNIQVKANLTYAGGNKALEVTAENVTTATDLYGPTALKATGITYWNK